MSWVDRSMSSSGCAMSWGERSMSSGGCLACLVKSVATWILSRWLCGIAGDPRGAVWCRAGLADQAGMAVGGVPMTRLP